MSVEQELVANIKALVGKVTLDDLFRTKCKIEILYTHYAIRKITIAPCCNIFHVYVIEIHTSGGDICQFHVSEDVMKS